MSYADPVELLISAVRIYAEAELRRRFAPDGEGVFMQEVVDARRLQTTEEMLDSFAFDDEDPDRPVPERDEWWQVFQWHPARSQILRGETLRARLGVD